MKNMYCTLDTETVGGASTPTGIYHLAGIIHDRNGNVYGCFNYLIAELFDMIEKDDYAKKNFDLYLSMLQSGVVTLIDTQENAVAMVEALCSYYDVNVMLAFNTAFDFVKTPCRSLIENREYIDLWLMALETICQKRSYKNFCIDNDKVNNKGTCSTSAETVYAFLIDNADYEEEHTALEDSKIEKIIFQECLRTHKKFTRNCHCWDSKNKFKLFPKV